MTKPSDPGNQLRAEISQNISVDFELQEDDLSKFAECIRRSGKVTLTLKNVGAADLGQGSIRNGVLVD